MIIPSIKYTPQYSDDKVELFPDFGVYGNGRLAISFVTEDDEPWSHLTVNLPNDHLNDGELFIKDWSENGDLVVALIDAGWITYTGREVSSGFVYPKVVTLSGDLAAYVKFINLTA